MPRDAVGERLESPAPLIESVPGLLCPPPEISVLSGGFPRAFSSAGDRSRRTLCFAFNWVCRKAEGKIEMDFPSKQNTACFDSGLRARPGSAREPPSLNMQVPRTI